MGIIALTENIDHDGATLSASTSDGFTLTIDALGDDLLRIALLPEGGAAVDRTWMIAPGARAGTDAPLEGRDRLSRAGFVQVPFSSDDQFTAGRLRVSIEASPLRLTVEQKVGAGWLPIFSDRQGGAWQWFAKTGRLKHFQALDPATRHFGLGDKTGPLDRTGRRLRCLQSDALGYDAETSDPLYKHAPWLILDHGKHVGGLLYDTMAEVVLDLGSEHSNYFERFRHVEVHEDAVVLYVCAGPTLADMPKALHRLTGFPALPPRWAFGFAFTSMHHADSANAQEVILDFAKEAIRREAPISAVHLGSGYTAGEDGLRYVFNWNESRFPDRASFFAQLADMGLKTCANVKPVLLTGHHAFAEAATSKALVKRADGSPAVEMFWGGQGAQIDFTSPAGQEFWRRGIGERVIGAGFDAVWNDNNEAELWDEDAEIDGFGAALPGMETRPVHALLMTRASFETMSERAPDKRPYTISRAGPIGISRYGETWSGDNATSWRTLKWNLRQGLSMALSGFPLVGHDIGGFVGPPPDEELLTRWFQMMALHPRCVMNSWKADHGNIPNLPWMHEQAWPAIRAALALRYRLLPTLYSLARQTAQDGRALIAPPGLHFPDMAGQDNDVFMLGPDILVAPVVEQGGRKVSVHLPDVPEGWVLLGRAAVSPIAHYPGGRSVTVNAPLDRLPLFARGGSVLALAKGRVDGWHNAETIELSVMPSFVEANRATTLFIDDGESRIGSVPYSELCCTALSRPGRKPKLEVREEATGIATPRLAAKCPTNWNNVDKARITGRHR